jgi:hypothetical protein
MIIYHPFKDANHCSYRIISLLYKNNSKIRDEHLNFMDFYYLFPCQMQNIDGWPRLNSKLARQISTIKHSYETIENPRRIFFELNIIRKNTLAHLFSKGILSLIDEYIFLNIEKIPTSLINTLETDTFRASFEFTTIANEIPKLAIKGKKASRQKLI